MSYYGAQYPTRHRIHSHLNIPMYSSQGCLDRMGRYCPGRTHRGRQCYRMDYHIIKTQFFPLVQLSRSGAWQKNGVVFEKGDFTLHSGLDRAERPLKNVLLQRTFWFHANCKNWYLININTSLVQLQQINFDLVFLYKIITTISPLSEMQVRFPPED
jgi:hypothetical protein